MPTNQLNSRNRPRWRQGQTCGVAQRGSGLIHSSLRSVFRRSRADMRRLNDFPVLINQRMDGICFAVRTQVLLLYAPATSIAPPCRWHNYRVSDLLTIFLDFLQGRDFTRKGDIVENFIEFVHSVKRTCDKDDFANDGDLDGSPSRGNGRKQAL